MSENTYTIKSWGDKEYNIRFSEMDDVFGCLCTFPFNDFENLSIDRIRSLALFGAAVRLAITDELTNCGEDGYVFLPDMLPKWIINAIRKI